MPSRIYLVLSLALLGGCAPQRESDEEALPTAPDTVAGYEPHVVRFRLRIDASRVRDCHAGRIAAGWLLTSAHCFSIAAPGAPGTLVDTPGHFDTSDVLLHPGALPSGRETHENVFSPETVRAAHDLALIRFHDEDEEELVDLWRPSADVQSCFALRGLRGSIVFHGRETPNRIAETTAAVALAIAQPKDLLGPGAGGEGEALLAATGSGVGSGDSGSLVTSSRAWMRVSSRECESSLPEESSVIGVIQDAHPSNPTAPFGIVPTFLPEHYEWIDQHVNATVPGSLDASDAGLASP